MSLLDPKMQDALAVVRATIDDIVRPLTKSTLSVGQFHEVNDKMLAYFKAAGFTDKQVEPILIRQWMRVANQFDIRLPESDADA